MTGNIKRSGAARFGMLRLAWAACTAGLLVAAPPARATVILSSGTSAIGTNVKTYTFGSYTAGSYAGYQVALGVYVGSYFEGQKPQGTDPITIAAPVNPGRALQLVYDANDYIQVTTDANAPLAQVIAGGPLTFREQLSIWFQVPVTGFGLTVGGKALTAGQLDIYAFDAAGDLLGEVVSTAAGYATYALTDPGGAPIAGVTIEAPGSLTGFALDGLVLPAPEPASALTLLSGAAGLFGARRRLRQTGPTGSASA